MRSDPSRHIISSIYDAALLPQLWPAALQSVMDAIGLVSAGYCIHNKQTGQVELLSLSGPLVETGTNYVSYYHDRDPQRALIEAAPSKTWVRLSERLPAPALQRDEWYNDFLLKAGLDDALRTQLSSILKKMRVERQADMIRALTSLPVIPR
jgi:hypothetical protein